MDFDFEKEFVSESPERTRAYAAALARSLGGCGVVALLGEMGAGKTVFAKGLAEGLGVDAVVKSPSFNVCLTYAGKLANFVHIDAYRLGGAEDFDSLLIDEIVKDPKLVCVEWPSIVSGAIPEGALWLEITIDPETNARKIARRKP